jgi:hypothetical protein
VERQDIVPGSPLCRGTAERGQIAVALIIEAFDPPSAASRGIFEDKNFRTYRHKGKCHSANQSFYACAEGEARVQLGVMLFSTPIIATDMPAIGLQSLVF